MEILFVCSRNRIRSLTAEHHLAGRPGLAVRSAGTVPSARVWVTAGHPSLRSRAGSVWADVVVVMEKRHQALLDLIEAGVEPLLDPATSVARQGRM